MAPANPIDRERTLKIATRLDAKDDGALPALNALTKILESHGSNWQALFSAWIDAQSPVASTTKKSSSSTRLDPIDDINNWMDGLDRSMHAAKPTRHEARDFYGATMPTEVFGIINVMTRYTTSKGQPMLIVDIENASDTYRALAVFDQALIAAIENGTVLSGSGRVRLATNASHLNVLTSFQDIRQASAA